MFFDNKNAIMTMQEKPPYIHMSSTDYADFWLTLLPDCRCGGGMEVVVGEMSSQLHILYVYSSTWSVGFRQEQSLVVDSDIVLL